MALTGPRLIDLLWHNVRLYPDKIALRIDGNARSFRELGRRTLELTRELGSIVQPGDRVGLWFHNCHAWVETFLALDALGAVSVPINTRLTGHELEVIFRAAELHAIVTTGSYRGRRYAEEACDVLDATGRRVWVFQASDQEAPASWSRTLLGGAEPEPHSSGQTPSEVFCIQYTSGTTSIPKGVMLTDAAYLSTAAYVARCQRLTPSSRFISAGPFFHCSGSMHALTVCLLAGCTLHSMSIWDPARFVDEVQTHQCDVSHMIYFRDVLSLGAPGTEHRLSSLQIGHELGTPDYLARVVDELGIPGLSNIYGMTETCGQFTMWFPDDPLELRVAGSGRPQPGNEIRIVDPDNLSERALGQAGEIQMRGPTVSAGYFRNPQAQAEAFTQDGWFRSGDLGRIGEQGQLIYVARLKEVIRVGGENLAPAEVEQALRDICQTQSVCVLAMPDDRLDEVVTAVLVGPANRNWPEVLSRLRQRLAGFKMPKAIYLAPEMPLTATNRVQRATLKSWIEAQRLERVM